MKFLVTGATGFIGSHLIELLLSKGWEVVCPVRNPSALKNLDAIPARVTSYDELESMVLSDARWDYLIHLAGATRARDYQAYAKANVELTRRLLDLMERPAREGHLRRFVLVSSQAAAGPAPSAGERRLESDTPAPVSLYGLSKLRAEEVALTYKDKLPITIVRPPTVFGPRDRDVLGVFKGAVHGIAPCLSGPDRLVSIVYVEDLVEGLLKAAFSQAAVGETYFLANPDPVIWREFTLLVARVMGHKAVSFPVPVAFLKLAGLIGDVASRIRGEANLFRSEKVEEMTQIAWVCSTEKARIQLDWRPQTPLEEAIGRTARWYKERNWI